MIERINRVIAHLKERREILSQREFAEKIGIKPSQISEMLRGKRPISERTIHKITQSFPDINSVWITTGEGEMLLSVSENEIEQLCDISNFSLAEAITLIKSQYEIIKSQQRSIENLSIELKKKHAPTDENAICADVG